MLKTAIVLCLVALVTATSHAPNKLHHPGSEVKAFQTHRHLLGDSSSYQLDFWVALNDGDIEGMRQAHDRGASAEDETKPSGYRPIHLAAAIGNLEALLLLVEYGVDVNAQTANGTTALHYAANHGDVLVMSMLLAADADPNLADSRGFVPIHFASYANQQQFDTGATVGSDYDVIHKEAATEVSVTSEARSKSTIPGMGEFVGCVDLLINFFADVNAATHLKETALHYTPAFDQYQITEKLIAAGANVNAVDLEGETPLHEATAYGAIGVTQLLLIHGADAGAKEENGLTPVDFICRCRTYRNDPTLTQCSSGKCNGGYDDLVLKRAFAVYNGED